MYEKGHLCEWLSFSVSIPVPLPVPHSNRPSLCSSTEWIFNGLCRASAEKHTQSLRYFTVTPLFHCLLFSYMTGSTLISEGQIPRTLGRFKHQLRLQIPRCLRRGDSFKITIYLYNEIKINGTIFAENFKLQSLIYRFREILLRGRRTKPQVHILIHGQLVYRK